MAKIAKQQPKQRSVTDRLVDLLDTFGHHADPIVLRKPETLKAFGLWRQDVTKKSLAAASATLRQWTDDAKARAWKLGGTWNGKWSPEEEQRRKLLQHPQQKENEEVFRSNGASRKRRSGPSTKMRIYQLWQKNKKLQVDEAIRTTEATVQPSTVKAWISSWLKGKGEPKR